MPPYRDPRDYRNYSDIEAAVRRLPILPEQTYYVLHLVDDLAVRGIIIDEMGGDGTVPSRFRPATDGMVKKELGELERCANDLANKIESGGRTKRAREQLAQHIREMRGPTIMALSDAPAFPTAVNNSWQILGILKLDCPRNWMPAKRLQVPN